MIERLCKRIVARIRDELSNFNHYIIRADPGYAGIIHVALRDAKHDREAGRRLAEALEPLLAEELGRESEHLDFAISLGDIGDDLVLQVEIRQI